MKTLKSFFASLLLLGCSSVLANDIGQVVIAKKHVEAQRAQALVPLERKSPVVKKDNVITGEQARAQIRLQDGTLFTLGENTQLLIDEYLFSDTEKPTALFRLTTGVFRAVTGKITQVQKPNFKVETPLGSIGIRGTDFWGGYLDEDKIDVILLSGEHPIIIENEFGRSVITQPGTGVTIEANQAPGEPRTWSEQKLARAVATITID